MPRVASSTAEKIAALYREDSRRGPAAPWKLSHPLSSICGWKPSSARAGSASARNCRSAWGSSSSKNTSARGLKVGDNLTLTLQDAPSYFGIVEDTGWDLDRDSLKSVTDTYEIVGIYDYLDTFIHNERPNTDVQSFAYVPAFALPEDFQLDYGSQMYYDYFYTPYSDFPMLFRGTASTLPYPGSVFFELVPK